MAFVECPTCHKVFHINPVDPDRLPERPLCFECWKREREHTERRAKDQGDVVGSDPGISHDNFAAALSSLNGHPVAVAVDRTHKGYLRIETMLFYPDGHSIDVFLMEQADELIVTDFGQTISLLIEACRKPIRDAATRFLWRDRLREKYGVEITDGAVESPVRSDEEIAGAVGRVALACQKWAGLVWEAT